MSKKTNIIEINGQRYDAVTGELLGSSHVSAKNLDGVVRAAQAGATPALSQPVAREPLKPLVKKPVMDIARAPGRPLKHHAPQSAHTLMRHTVTKPSSTHAHLKAQTPTDALAKQPAVVVHAKLSHHAINPKRQKHATRVAKSELVSRFNSVSYTGSSNQVFAMSKPVAQIALESQVASLAQTVSKPAAGTQSSLDIFQKALAEATSHEQRYAAKAKKSLHSPKRKLGHRSVRTASAVLAVAVVVGLATYQHVPNLKLRLAAAHIGFQAHLPGYRPAGFAVGDVSYDVGNVAINYHSNSDSRAYTVTEKISNWDSQTLQTEYVVPTAGQSYQTVQAGGRTIYLLNDEATWVNNGIWYVIHNNGQLSSRQLVDLASSV